MMNLPGSLGCAINAPNALLGQEYDKVDAMREIMIKSDGQAEFTGPRIAELCGFCAQREDGTFKDLTG